MLKKYFNTEGDCKQKLHYMVDITEKLYEIKTLVDKGNYFTINRTRQYGKTTTLRALSKFLNEDYLVLSLDFQVFGNENFESEGTFSTTFARTILQECKNINKQIISDFKSISECPNKRLYDLFEILSKWCEYSEKPIVLLIDEVDSASNNQVFLDFLSQLRGYYLNRDMRPTFHSVVLAGVYDIKNLKLKMHPNEFSKRNSPWNIAADFDVDMSFSAKNIAEMLCDYAKDHHITMNVPELSQLIFDYTSGYPFLVSRICKIIDEKLSKTDRFQTLESAWTKDGFLAATKKLLDENNTLFESLINKLYDFENIRKLIYTLLMTGRNILYTATNTSISTAQMFGFIKKQGDFAVISNRIFEIVLYNHILSEEILENKMYDFAITEKNQFISDGTLNMELILEKFILHFSDIYGNKGEDFIEDAGRKYFLLYLKPIINGIGNYYIESQTRDMRRTDVIIDYHGTQYIVEMKIWHGDEYNKRGEQQFIAYLDYYHLHTGYMLSFNFNKNKKIGIQHIEINGKTLIEAVV